MSDIAVITPSYSPDAELFDDLHRSVRDHTASNTVHHVIVPARDRVKFAGHSGSRCRVWTVPDLLPGHYVQLPVDGWWTNIRRPWPPVRGWILQQAVKIAATAAMDAENVLVVDSDVVLVRPIDAAGLRENGHLRLYRVNDAVHAGMERHIRWHQVARRLLGLDPQVTLPLHDYVSPFNVWDPAVVRAMQMRISETTGMDWLRAFTAELHISEFVLYGVFVDEVLGARRAVSYLSTSFCHNYWETKPLDEPAAEKFASEISADALAMMISAKSGTPRSARWAAEVWCRKLIGSSADVPESARCDHA